MEIRELKIFIANLNEEEFKEISRFCNIMDHCYGLINQKNDVAERYAKCHSEQMHEIAKIQNEIDLLKIGIEDIIITE